jgi:DNA repair protein RadC
MLLSKSNKVPGIASTSKGGISGTVTDVRIILQYSIKANASGIIICHNHSSSNVQPSESDIVLKKKIRNSGIVMDVQLLDHLIIVPEGKDYCMGDYGFFNSFNPCPCFSLNSSSEYNLEKLDG